MAVITQQLPEFTGDNPNKTIMTPGQFDLAAEAWAGHQIDLEADVNTWVGEVNAVADSANLLYAAADEINFRGKWSALTGAIYRPAVVWHNYGYWMLLAPFLPDVAAYEPVQGSAIWAPVSLPHAYVFAGGDPVVLDMVSAAHYLRRPVIYTNHQTVGNVSVVLPGSPEVGMTARFVCGGDYRLRVFAHQSQFRWGPRVVSDLYYYSYLIAATKGTVWDIHAEEVDRDKMGWAVTNIFGGTLTAGEAPYVLQT